LQRPGQAARAGSKVVRLSFDRLGPTRTTKGEIMTNSPQRQSMSLFVGPSEQLQTLATWLDDLNRAAFSHATDGEGSEEFIVDLGALNKVLAVGKGALGCLSIVDAQKCSGMIGELQRDAAARLAGGLDGILEPSAQQQQAGTRLQCKLREVMPYFHWLGVCVRDKLAADTNAGADNGGPAEAMGKPPKRKAGVNARMLETIQKDQDAIGWNSTEWATHLRCVKSSVVATQAWKDLKMGRDRRKAERALDRRRRPKGSDLNRG